VIRTKVDVVSFVDAQMAALFTTALSSRVSRVSRVGRVSIMVRVRVSVNKYRCERLDNDAV